MRLVPYCIAIYQMAADSLGLTPHHEEHVVEYLHFARFKRAQCLKTIDASFQDLAESRLVEDTFTSDEVQEMLTGLCGLVKADVGSDLINSSHTNALLLRQLFQRAEKWHLKLQANVSEIEDKDLLDQVAQLEESRVKSSPSHAFITHKSTQLEPMNSFGGDKLLQMEIKRLEDENNGLKERLRTVESKVSTALSEKDQLKSDIAMQKQLSGDTVDGGQSEEIESLREEISQLKLSQVRSPGREATSSDALAETSHELLRVTDELEKTKQELEQKFNGTSQYQNMKKMLASKNTTISELRAKLRQYET